MSNNKDFDYYISLPYKIVLYPAKEGGFVVEIPDLPGCISQGDDLEDAYKMIEDAKRSWIELALDNGREVPEPRDSSSEDDYSGKFVLRIPKSLHRTLSEKAKEESVSLNQYIAYLLARGSGESQENIQ